jgi:hypothetical protein
MVERNDVGCLCRVVLNASGFLNVACVGAYCRHEDDPANVGSSVVHRIQHLRIHGAICVYDAMIHDATLSSPRHLSPCSTVPSGHVRYLGDAVVDLGSVRRGDENCDLYACERGSCSYLSVDGRPPQTSSVLSTSLYFPSPLSLPAPRCIRRHPVRCSLEIVYSACLQVPPSRHSAKTRGIQASSMLLTVFLPELLTMTRHSHLARRRSTCHRRELKREVKW